MELSQTLAQEIVERAMRILPGNVNVMDASGLIIGSGDPTRLFSHHAGARQVIAEGRAVALDASAAAGLAGAQAGINLPLYHQGELVGVLGVSGEDAERLRLPAELLRLTAEMLIEQAAGQPPATARMTTPLLRQLLAPGAAPELGAPCHTAWAEAGPAAGRAAAGVRRASAGFWRLGAAAQCP